MHGWVVTEWLTFACINHSPESFKCVMVAHQKPNGKMFPTLSMLDYNLHSRFKPACIFQKCRWWLSNNISDMKEHNCMPVLRSFSNARVSFRYRANKNYPKANRCYPHPQPTAPVQTLQKIHSNSHHIQMGFLHTGGFNAMLQTK